LRSLEIVHSEKKSSIAAKQNEYELMKTDVNKFESEIKQMENQYQLTTANLISLQKQDLSKVGPESSSCSSASQQLNEQKKFLQTEKQTLKTLRAAIEKLENKKQNKDKNDSTKEKQKIKTKQILTQTQNKW
jgi:hypothetical protein